MSREPVSKEIDGRKFITVPLAPITIGPALGLYSLSPRIAKLVAPVIQMVMPILGTVGAGSKNKDDIEKKVEALLRDPKGVEKLAPALEALANGLALPENVNLPTELLCRTQVEELGDDDVLRRFDINTAKAINEHLEFFTLLKVMWFVASVNFGGFFTGGPTSPIKS